MADPSDLDRRRAWAVARALRQYREWLIGEVASGALNIDGLFAEYSSGGGLGTVKVVVVAQAVPGVGKVRARRAMAGVGIGEDARWGEIDEAVLRALWSAMAEASALPIVNRRAQARSASSSVSER